MHGIARCVEACNTPPRKSQQVIEALSVLLQGKATWLQLLKNW